MTAPPAARQAFGSAPRRTALRLLLPVQIAQLKLILFAVGFNR